MSRGKYQAAPKPIPAAALILAVLVLLGTMIGGAAAYLSASADAVANRFEAAPVPTVTVLENNSVAVTDPGYALYLRGTVLANWVHKDTGNILAQNPQEGTDYQLELGDGWAKSGGFYYYTAPIQSDFTTAPMVTITIVTSKTGYQLVLKVMTQTIQAVGQTDAEPPVNAVVDAWGVQPEDLAKNRIDK